MHSIPEMLLGINNRGDRKELLKLNSSNIFRLQQQLQQENVFFVKNKMLWDFLLYSVDCAATLSSVM
jgi:hypothetical protein